MIVTIDLNKKQRLIAQKMLKNVEALKELHSQYQRVAGTEYEHFEPLWNLIMDVESKIRLEYS